MPRELIRGGHYSGRYSPRESACPVFGVFDDELTEVGLAKLRTQCRQIRRSVSLSCHQDTFARAFVALDELEEICYLRKSTSMPNACNINMDVWARLRRKTG
jgi:hypothetical protein